MNRAMIGKPGKRIIGYRALVIRRPPTSAPTKVGRCIYRSRKIFPNRAAAKRRGRMYVIQRFPHSFEFRLSSREVIIFAAKVVKTDPHQMEFFDHAES